LEIYCDSGLRLKLADKSYPRVNRLIIFLVGIEFILWHLDVGLLVMPHVEVGMMVRVFTY